MARGEAREPAASEDAGLRRAIEVLVELELILVRRSLAGVLTMVVVVVERGTEEAVLREARVFRTGTEMLLVPVSFADVAIAGEGPLVPFEGAEGATFALAVDAEV